MNDSICLSRKSKKNNSILKRCTNKKIPNKLFCGIHKNSKELYDGVSVDDYLASLNIGDTVKNENENEIIILPSREIQIISLNDYEQNTNILNRLKRHDLIANLKNYNLDKKGKKNELLTRLKDYFENNLHLNKSINHITLLQGYIRKNLLFNRYGPAIGIRKLCHNDTDYLLNENISEIPHELFISYNDDKFVYGFTVNSFKQLINWNCKKNPYNNLDIPQYAINILENRLDYIKSKNIQIEEYQKPILTKQEKINQQALDIFYRIDKLGNYTDHRWFMDLNMKQLQKFYSTLEDIWFYRAELTNEIRDRITNNVPVFTIKPSVIQLWNSKCQLKLQELMLSNFDVLISNSTEIDDHKHGALLILTALVDVSPEACIAHPLLAQALWGV